MAHWSPGHGRGKRLCAASNGRKIVSVGHVEYGGWWIGGEWWRRLAPGGVTDNKFRGLYDLFGTSLLLLGGFM